MDKINRMYQSGEAPYDHFEDFELYEIATMRGVGMTRGDLLKALREQDQLHAKSTFPFMSLPLELREMIYGYVCADIWFDIDDGPPALTCVNSQVRKECLPILFAVNPVRLRCVPARQDLAGGGYVNYQCLHNQSRKMLRRLSYRVDHFRTIRVRYVLKGDWLQWIQLILRRNPKATPQYSVTLHDEDPRLPPQYVA